MPTFYKRYLDDTLSQMPDISSASCQPKCDTDVVNTE